MIYRVKIELQAIEDVEKVIDYIEYELLNPVAAVRFFDGLYATIKKLRFNADIFAKSIYRDVLKYDIAARHVTYKGFAIIYSIHGDLVLVHRVIHGSLIKE